MHEDRNDLGELAPHMEGVPVTQPMGVSAVKLNLIAAIITAVGTIVAVSIGIPWLAALNAFLCGINILAWCDRR